MIDFTEYGYHGDEKNLQGCIPARVTAVHRGEYRLICAYGEATGKLKGAKYYSADGEFEGYGSELYPTVGDFVWLQYQGEGDSLVTDTMPRRSVFTRRSPHCDRGEQTVAANFDLVFITMSLNQNFNIKRIERYLTAAWQSGGTPVIVLTKADLIPPEEVQERVQETKNSAIGVEVLPVSAHTGQGMEGLSAYLTPGTTSVFLGSSGVGKSSLVNAIAGEERMKVNEIREEDARGRHTTTHRQLLRLASGVLVIDTPGMRELGMWDVTDGISAAFTEIEQLAEKCRFTDCTHGMEPGCAIRAALEEGALPSERWENYQSLKREARFHDKKEFIRQHQQLRRQNTSGGKERRGSVRKKRGFENDLD